MLLRVVNKIDQNAWDIHTKAAPRPLEVELTEEEKKPERQTISQIKFANPIKRLPERSFLLEGIY